jgi:glycosyltransferase involved in cell wall biosynthesis
MSQPLVSIIIPTYNRAHLIQETLNSIQLQSYQNWECIIVDDGSTDASEEVITDFCKSDERFKYYKRPEDKPKGANTCRNLGFEYSKGDLINWFDSDDVMFETFLEKKVKMLQSYPETAVVSSGFVKYNPLTHITSKQYNTDLKDTPLNAYANNELSLNTPTFLYKRAILNGISFDENLSRAQDLDFTFRVISKPNVKMSHTNEVLFKVLIHDNSITGKFTDKISLKHLKSELQVRKYIAFFYLNNNQKLTKYIFDNYLKALKKVLENRQFLLYCKELYQVPTIGFVTKMKLFFIAVTYAITGKGIASFGRQIKKIKV